jgi:spermidine/putrescine transport system permease protein
MTTSRSTLRARREERRGWLFASPAWIWLLVFVLAPLTIMTAHSLFGIERFRLGTRLTFDNYRLLFASDLFLRLFLKTVAIAAATTGLCLLLGYLPAYRLAFRPGPRTQLLLSLLLLPYVVGYIPRILSLRMILGREGLINQTLLALRVISEPLTNLLFSNLATVIGLTYVQLPVMIILLYISLEQIAPSLLEASQDLGASQLYTFWRLVVPLSRTGMLNGVLLVFLSSLGAYVEPALLGGADGQLLGNIIAQRFIVFMDMARGSAMALLTVLVMLALVLATVSLAGWRRGHARHA